MRMGNVVEEAAKSALKKVLKKALEEVKGKIKETDTKIKNYKSCKEGLEAANGKMNSALTSLAEAEKKVANASVKAALNYSDSINGKKITGSLAANSVKIGTVIGKIGVDRGLFEAASKLIKLEIEKEEKKLKELKKEKESLQRELKGL